MRTRPGAIATTLLASALVLGCGGADADNGPATAESPPQVAAAGAPAAAAAPTEGARSELTLTSPAFADGGAIPPRFARRQLNLSPPLEISGAPAGTRSFALVVEDADAPTGSWVHWVVWGIPADTRSIVEGELPEAATEGSNSWAESGWGGPQPPSGTHHYSFHLYALDTDDLGLEPGARRQVFESAIDGHVLAETTLTGTFAAGG